MFFIISLNLTVRGNVYYYCDIRNLSIISCTCIVPETPSITANSDTAVAGSSFTLSCSATPPTGLTVSSYQWTDSNGGTLSSSDSYTIDSVLVSSAGTYTCTATVSHSNEYVLIQNSTATDTATLTVTSKQTMTTFHLRERGGGEEEYV